MSFYTLSAKNNRLKEVSMGELKGKVVLIVNTASKCGLTPQYEGLEALHQKYKDRGLAVLGFPCNQFLFQEPGTNEDIENFCKLNFGVTFPLMDKINVNGAKTHPIFGYLRNNAKNARKGAVIKWNFTKFLISKDGGTIMRFEPNVLPAELEQTIESLL